MGNTPKSLFKLFAFAEAVSWTLLIAGIILRATADLAIAVTIGGAIHGFVFLGYAATALLVAIHQRWSFPVAAAAVISAIIPYATIPAEIWLNRSGRLEGHWKLTASEDPKDQRFVDRVMRWMLNHPFLLIAIAAIVVVGLYVSLLLIGPPGGSHS
ncbi:DUF3817 domain-containing protein [Humidisolicoccus flavus]|uniref:DUF3817 domain-containing protein n=1 Tax=Humidisolicoccus flavus TaxID=3111414 RepID=UPI00324EF038